MQQRNKCCSKILGDPQIDIKIKCRGKGIAGIPLYQNKIICSVQLVDLMHQCLVKHLFRSLRMCTYIFTDFKSATLLIGDLKFEMLQHKIDITVSLLIIRKNRPEESYLVETPFQHLHDTYCHNQTSRTWLGGSDIYTLLMHPLPFLFIFVITLLSILFPILA